MADKILEALNKLVEKQGGTTEDNKLIVDAINDLVETGGGSSGGGFVIGVTEDPETYMATLDKTFNEIRTALESGANVVIKAEIPQEIGQSFDFIRVRSYFAYTGEEESSYSVTMDDSGSQVSFVTNNPDGYPSAFFD